MARNSTTTVRSASGHPAGSYGDLKTLSELVGYIRRNIKDAVTGSDHFQEAAVISYRGVKKASKVPTGVNKIFVAAKVRRHLNKAAAAEEMKAKHLRIALVTLNGSFGEPKSARAARTQGGMDTTR